MRMRLGKDSAKALREAAQPLTGASGDYEGGAKGKSNNGAKSQARCMSALLT
jgi:hypothetical protein